MLPTSEHGADFDLIEKVNPTFRWIITRNHYFLNAFCRHRHDARELFILSKIKMNILFTFLLSSKK